MPGTELVFCPHHGQNRGIVVCANNGMFSPCEPGKEYQDPPEGCLLFAQRDTNGQESSFCVSCKRARDCAATATASTATGQPATVSEPPVAVAQPADAVIAVEQPAVAADLPIESVAGRKRKANTACVGEPDAKRKTRANIKEGERKTRSGVVFGRGSQSVSHASP